MNQHESYNAAAKRYVVGGVGSASLIIITYLAVTGSWFEKPMSIAFFVLVLAFLQLVLQLVTFLHVQAEAKPRWKSIGFVSSMIMITVVVAGSIWVMYNLNYRMHTSGEAMQEYMLEQNKKGF